LSLAVNDRDDEDCIYFDVASEVTYIDPMKHIAITTGRTLTTTNRTGTAIPVIFVKTCKGGLEASHHPRRPERGGRAVDRGRHCT
jgi:hypothetical protein